jgi:hypothetical protein
MHGEVRGDIDQGFAVGTVLLEVTKDKEVV